MKARGFLRTNRSLKITRQGKILIGVILVVGVAVLNTGNNLLFLCLGLLLSIITVSGILSEWNVRDVTLSLHHEALVFAEMPQRFEVEITNHHHRRFIYSLVIHASWKSVSDPERNDGICLISALQLAPGHSETFSADMSFAERGEYKLDKLWLETEYPFGLFRKIRLFPHDARILVAPKPEPGRAQTQTPMQTVGEVTRDVAGHSIEFFDLREATPTDDIRHIAWAKSAARGSLVAIRRASDSTDAAVVAVRGGKRGDARFEQALKYAASLVLQRMKRGAPTGLRLGTAEVRIGVGASHELTLLSSLAQADEGATPRPSGMSKEPLLWVEA